MCASPSEAKVRAGVAAGQSIPLRPGAQHFPSLSAYAPNSVA